MKIFIKISWKIFVLHIFYIIVFTLLGITKDPKSSLWGFRPIGLVVISNRKEVIIMKKEREIQISFLTIIKLILIVYAIFFSTDAC